MLSGGLPVEEAVGQRGGALDSQASTTASRRARLPTRSELDSTAGYPSKCGMVKKPGWAAASTTSFSSRSSTHTARIGPSGGVASPKRLRSALLNGRSQANALPATNQVRRPWRSPSVTSGSSRAIRAASSTVAMVNPSQALARPIGPSGYSAAAAGAR